MMLDSCWSASKKIQKTWKGKIGPTGPKEPKSWPQTLPAAHSERPLAAAGERERGDFQSGVEDEAEKTGTIPRN